jgi:hypothetical protein
MLEPREYDRIHRALLNAFPTPSELAMFTDSALDLNLDEIAPRSDSLNRTMLRLVQWAEANGRLEELLEQARRERPNNEILQAIISEVQATIEPEKTSTSSDSPVVFLCHSSGDKAAVKRLDRRLRGDGFRTWLDENELLPGQEWDPAIKKAVRGADMVIVCLSGGSITKAGYVQKEIRYVLDVAEEQPEGAIFLIPARLEDCRVPERLSTWQWVDLYKRGGYNRLLAALHKAQDLRQ